ncbi:MAG: Cob(I)yrinic acid a,c-diamide adenosyltransferase [Chlamydiae bacterium]|nr:Cob(I)yrinic acid a,c-diamide adenosyltransferase [Chlamydiota bacterium]
MKIYTKTGDKGETSLFTGQRVPKNDPLIDALGTVDECNSAIGVAITLLPDDAKFGTTMERLTIIQHALFDLGAAVATPRTRAANAKIDKTRFDAEEIELIEKWIDEMDNELPKLDTFILPGGHPSSAMLQLARSICRRAERLMIPLNHHADVSDRVIKYLNRLSDYLFITSRYVNVLTNYPETKWKPHLTAKD